MFIRSHIQLDIRKECPFSFDGVRVVHYWKEGGEAEVLQYRPTTCTVLYSVVVNRDNILSLSIWISEMFIYVVALKRNRKVHHLHYPFLNKFWKGYLLWVHDWRCSLKCGLGDVHFADGVSQRRLFYIYALCRDVM